MSEYEVPIGTSYAPGLFTWPLTAINFNPRAPFFPRDLYQSAPLARIVNISIEAALVSLVTFFFLTMMAEPLLLEYDR